MPPAQSFLLTENDIAVKKITRERQHSDIVKTEHNTRSLQVGIPLPMLKATHPIRTGAT
jgi:hypothetical protein